MSAPSITLSELMASQPSGANSWHHQAVEMAARLCLCCGQPGHHQQMIDRAAQQSGQVPPIYMENGQVKDGNHRALAAMRCLLPEIPLESAEASGERWLRDHGYNGWLGRRRGDITKSEMSWVFTDALMKLWGDLR